MPDYQFFFSYAHDNYETATDNSDKSRNYLDDFYYRICQTVSDIMGISNRDNNNNEKDNNEEDNKNPKMIAYYDLERRKTGKFWNEHLLEGLDNSRVLVAVFSPSYFESESCGKEFQFFIDKQDKKHSYIVPILWVDYIACSKKITDLKRKNFLEGFFTQFEYREKDIESYPGIGLVKAYRLNKMDLIREVVQKISDRIVELARESPLSSHKYNPLHFNELPSAWPKVDPSVGGPNSTNVIYIVGSKGVMEKIGYSNLLAYDNSPENCKPFSLDSNDKTIERATRNGIESVGQKYRNLGPPENLSDNINKAREKNSTILMVLDHNTLSDSYSNVDFTSKHAMCNYGLDRQIHPHVGLVTAVDSKEVTEDNLRKVFSNKYDHPNYVWSKPKDCQTYITSVRSVVENLKNQLESQSIPSIPLNEPQPTRSSAPGLSAPSRE